MPLPRTHKSASIFSRGSSYDRRVPDTDHDPTAKLLNYEDINISAKKAGAGIDGLFRGLASVFGFPSVTDLLTNPVGTIWNTATNLFIKPLGAFAQLFGGLISSLQIPILDPTQILNLPALFTNVSNIASGIFNGWFGGGGAGTPAEVEQTIIAIKDAIVGGWTIHTFTSSNPNWMLPAGVSVASAIVMGGGGRGFSGTNSTGTANSAVGGKSGGYSAQDLDLTGLTPGTTQLAIVVGAGGASPGDDGQLSSIKVVGSGATLLQSTPNLVGINDPRGYPVLTPAGPGRGGNGGGADGSNGYKGEDGEDTIPAGGLGGNGGSGNGTSASGTAGGPGEVAAPIKFGGAGGGGGGGRTGPGLTTLNGGNGGPGGYPAGAGGAGGSVSGPVTASRNPGTGGFGAIGLVVILTKGES